jgi:hypothetical protein
MDLTISRGGQHALAVTDKDEVNADLLALIRS